jgi:type II restriction enzyme
MVALAEARELLSRLGLPKAQQSLVGAYTVLVLSGLGPKSSWASASRRSWVIHDILVAMRTEWDHTYAENSRETVRRQVLHQLEQARIVDRNPDDLNLPTNSPRSHYALTPPALKVIRTFGTPAFDSELKSFQTNFGSLAEQYNKARSARSVPVVFPDGLSVTLSPGQHNMTQKAVVEVMLPRFAPGSSIVYLGDTAKKALHVDRVLLTELALDVSEHSKLPDVVAWDRARDWLFLVEVVTSHGPVSPKRERELRLLFEKAGRGLIFVTAFPDLRTFRKHAGEVAWETEVWIAEHPSHLIHYDGDRFVGPHVS